MSDTFYLFLFITAILVCLAIVFICFLKIKKHRKLSSKSMTDPIVVRRKFAFYNYEDVISEVRKHIIKNKFGRSSFKG
jgi:hypothetical protein